MRSLSICCVLLVVTSAQAMPDNLTFFETKIRPVLVDACYSCHSASKKIRGGLELDSRAALLKGGDTGPAIVLHEPDKSLLMKAIRYHDPELRMPPRGKLTETQIADFAAWIKAGAVWPDSDDTVRKFTDSFNLIERLKHWSFQPLAPPPAGMNSVDAFLDAKLAALNLTKAPPTDRPTLLRRVYFGLIGLPPTPEQIEAFVNDSRPDAFARVVDQLLSSPHYGERWARHWLDLVRYAETSGHEFDFPIPAASEYRDYVIRAFNADVPYNEFVREHIAGDLLARPRRHPQTGTNESILGTGFFFLGESKHSPVDIRAEWAERADNMLDVFGKTFLGLTLGCARCHDHKFDPISTKDYYALAGYLRSSRMQLAFLDDPEPRRPILERISATRKVYDEQLTASAQQNLRGFLESLEKSPKQVHSTSRLMKVVQTLSNLTDNQFSDGLKRWLAAEQTKADRYADWERKSLPLNDFAAWTVTGEGVSISTHGRWSADGPGLAGLRCSPRGALDTGSLSGNSQGAVRSTTFEITKKYVVYRFSGRQVRVNLIIDNFHQIRDPIYGGLTFVINSPDVKTHIQNVGMWLGHRAYVEVLDDGPGAAIFEDVRLTDEPPPELPWPPELRQALSQVLSAKDFQAKLSAYLDELLMNPVRLSSAEVAILNDLAHLASTDLRKLNTHDLDLARKVWLSATEGLPSYNRGLALADGTGENERVAIRGNPNNFGPVVPRRFLEGLAGLNQPTPTHGSGRLELAQQVTDPKNPLISRVIVNRLWKHHFGEGLVRSPDDFGRLGQPPSHPELLDWLASEFILSGWSLKQMHRRLVLSEAYQRSSSGSAESERLDPRNQWLHRMPVRRLEAEAIRDTMLQVSGRFDPKMFGPSVPPYLTNFMTGRGRPSHSGPLDGAGRRSIYLAVRRNFLNPMFVAFDFPTPFTTIGHRSVSNVPAQALVLLNNPFVLEQSRRWGQRIWKTTLSMDERIQRMYLEAFGRSASSAELLAAKEFLGEATETAYTDFAHVLFNAKEFTHLR